MIFGEYIIVYSMINILYTVRLAFIVHELVPSQHPTHPRKPCALPTNPKKEITNFSSQEAKTKAKRITKHTKDKQRK